SVIAALHERFADVAGPDVSDICYATQNRQNAVRALVEECDALIVVGAANSSNSNRLRDVALALGKPAWLVGDASEVSIDWLDGVERLGVTAGASAPEELVEDVIATIALSRKITVSELDGIRENVSFSLPAALRRAAPLSLPLGPALRIAGHAISSQIKGGKYPLVLMLEPLLRCNLACPGCGKIDYPDAILNRRLSVEE
ncbi:hypothetical protein E4T56_gene23, partial [Termitomyces sp. T112]